MHFVKVNVRSVFTIVHHWSVSWTISMKLPRSHFIYFKILSIFLSTRRPYKLSLSFRFCNQNPQCISVVSMHAVCPTYLTQPRDLFAVAKSNRWAVWRVFVYLSVVFYSIACLWTVLFLYLLFIYADNIHSRMFVTSYASVNKLNSILSRVVR